MNRRLSSRFFRPCVEPLEDRSVPATITVTTNVDEVTPNNGAVSLREAIFAANADSATYPPNVVVDNDVIANTTGAFGDDDTIVFAAGVNSIVLIPFFEESSPFGALGITDSLTIQGPGSGLLTVSGNNATGIFSITSTAAQVDISGLTVANGAAGVLNGGGFQIDTNVFLDDVVIRNSSATNGGGIFLASGVLTLGAVSISNNSASINGGGIAVAFPTPAGTRISSLTRATIEGNTASNVGGGIFLGGAQLDGSGFHFDGNAAELGGGVFALGGNFVLADSTFVDNIAEPQNTDQPNLGGAIYSQTGLGSVERTTFTNNFALRRGGAIYHSTGPEATTLTITNSTFVGNSVGIFGALALRGGGLYLDASNTPGVGFIPVALVHVTITQNSADESGGGLALIPTAGGGPAASLMNSIVAGNTAPTAPDILGLISSGGNNLIGNTAGATGFVASDIVNVANPGLAPLAFNGGPTQTVALLPGSPALGNANPTGAPPTDQRGLPRPAGGPTDIGAFQAQIPTGAPDLYSAPFDLPLVVPAPGVLVNDVSNDPAYPVLTSTLVSPPPATEGSVTLNPDGSLTFTPATGFSGTTSFTYTVSNGTGLGSVKSSPPVTVSIVVDAPVPPIANPDSFSTAFGQPLTVPAPGVLGNDVVNNPNRSLSAVLDTPPLPTEGSVSLNSDGSFTFIPAPTFSGTTSFTYRATDGVSTSPPTTVTINVAAPIPPIANPDAFSIGSNQSLTVPAPGVLGNDVVNNPNRALSAVLDTAPLASDGTLVLNPDGSFTFTAALTFSGTATFSYRATDGASASAPATVTITGQAQTHIFAVGAGAGGGPVVRVFNEDETQRFAFFAFDPAFDGGVRVAVGDVTGDRFDDIVVGPGPGGGPHVKVFDGVTGAEVASFFAYAPDFSLGVHLAVGDVNNDGFADIITGAGSGGGPNVKVFSGRDQTELLSFFAYDPGFRGGARVAAGDLDGAGGAEIVTIAGPSGGPDVRVWDQSAAILDQFFAFDPGYRAGAFVTVLDGHILVAPDSFPDFDGSLLANEFTRFPGSRGAVGPALPSAALLTRQPQAFMFDFPVDGGDDAAVPTQILPVLDPGFLGGVRIAAGRYQGEDGLFATAGPGGDSRIQFFPYDGELLTPVPTLDDVALLDPGFLGSVYVGAGVGETAPVTV